MTIRKKHSPLTFPLLILCHLLLLMQPAWAEDQENYTYKLTQSTTAFELWTTPPSERVFKDDAVPAESGSNVLVYAAGNEFEPFQLVVRPVSSGAVTVDINDFGAGIETEIFQVKYVYISQVSDNLGRTGDYPDPLWPLEKGAQVNLTAGQNTPFWFSIRVPEGTPAGDYTTNALIGGMSVPITLHVFHFNLPAELHVKSQMNVSHYAILDKYGVSGTGSDYWRYVEAIKQYFIDHRLTPKGALWSGGLTTSGAAPYIEYDCAGNLSDPYGVWGFEEPAARYLAGSGLMSGLFTETFNDGTGFPSFMAATFQNNDSSLDQRPSSFCGLTRTSSDWYLYDNPDSPYNQQWFAYITAIRNYLDGLGYLDRAYYYFANEPQDQADYDAVVWYSRYVKEVAPGLKLMVSEEPKPEIFDHADYVSDGQIDIWLPVLNQYDPEVSHERQTNHGEESWIYFLSSTKPPYYNPITLDHPGIESKFTGWLLWKYRLRGIAYYAVNSWSLNPWVDPMAGDQNGELFLLYPPSETNTPIAFGSNNHRFVPSIRFELMRDSLEDYEYLQVLNNKAEPQVGVVNPADIQADKIISGLTSYTRDSGFLYNLRRLIGLKNGGEISDIPDISPPGIHPRSSGEPGNYYINFQDPAAQPLVNPLTVDGKTYMKIGWNDYDIGAGYGWYGDMAHVKYQYLSTGPNELQKSIIYDDWGRLHTFEFDLPNGTYKVTVSVGWYGRTYSHHKIDIEGVSFVDDEATTPEAPYLVRTQEVTVSDYKLTMAMGIFDEYTMLNYLDIEGVVPARWLLTVSRKGDGEGMVSGSPAGIDCGVLCLAEYVEDTLVELTATPAAGSVFIGWSGDCGGTGTCQVVMDSPRSITANFIIYSADREGDGDVDGSDLSAFARDLAGSINLLQISQFAEAFGNVATSDSGEF
ncbi:MAG: DUF4091 domain-containing protein [Proteobacteria bacterium]|nr:DUF4091 domain-containing protein [Pseudomonadota bacterium]MBU4298390.1 DUF4091 domain-containing protein [Pseudomonadota bacterium]MCG2749833.1 DUF4091 domain-containing protein [Desulfobulbaceae bacterium]